MKANLKLKALEPYEIANAVGGKLYTYGNGAARSVTNIVYDSREVSDGSLFCAIKGERVDGHDYIKQVVEGGAAVVLAESIPDGAEDWGDYSIVLTDNSVEALGLLAGYYRTFSSAKTVGVTGSVGKTTTKDFIASVLSASFKTMKTEGNHNNEVGFPMTLFSLTPECEVAVLEMGMSARGEISFMTRLAKPDVAVITNIGTSHIASLGSRENISLAKLEIAEGMSGDGVLIMNGDEPLLTEYKGEIAPERKYIGVYNKNADYKAVNIRMEVGGMTFDVLYDKRAAVNVEIPVLGRHNVYNALAAWAVGTTFGMTEADIRHGLLSFEGTEMRQKIYQLGKITVIEDCYNAAPESMRAAIEVLAAKAKTSGGAPCALLGDMLELGEDSRLMHDQLGQFAAQMKLERLYCYGEMADTVAEAAVKKGIRAENVYVSADITKPEHMAGMIASSIRDGDVLLVKASRGVAAEKVLEELKKLI
jgi:UDP-N-acetylmuramoyl-tripeptide--D-alanyl-D-alanine ligase